MNKTTTLSANHSALPIAANGHRARSKQGQKNKFRTLFLCLGMALSAQASDDLPASGGLRITPDPTTPHAIRELPLKHTRVEVDISGFVSRVKVEQVFENPCATPIEAVYVFPLPQNAAVNDMSIRIGDRLIKGEIKRREEARKIYEEAKNAGKTAALLNQERPNIFSQSVANIMPGHEIRIEIAYDEVLTYEKGGYEFAFPMVVGPRFIPGTPSGKQGGGWSPDTDQVPDASKITPPVLKPGERNGHDIELIVRLNAGVPIRRLQSPSHDILIEPAPTDDAPLRHPVVIRLAPRDTVPNKDFVLRYATAGERPEMAMLTHHDGQDGYFMLMFQPPEKAVPAEITPKELVFVMDCSGSMSGEPIALAKQAVRHALNNLNPNDTFQIIRFSESASPFAQTPLPATPDNIRRGLSYINGLSGGGGTMMIEGIKAALDYPHAENRLRIVCFMTDGYIGNEKDILAAIEKKIGDDTRLFSFGVGSSVNRYLLERMAEVGRGEVHYVLLNENPDKTVEKFYERVRHPALTHIRIDWGDVKVADLTPARIKDLFIGQPIFLMGRYRQSARGEIRIRGKMAGEEQMFPLSVDFHNRGDGLSEPSALAALWARSRIRELEAEQYDGENKDVVRAITDLALKYRLMSAYTSFVAVEEKVVNENGQLKTIQVPVEMPEGVSHEGVFGRQEELGYQGRLAASVASPMSFVASRKRVKILPQVDCSGTVNERADKSAGFDEPSDTEAEPIPDFTIILQMDTETGKRVLEVLSNGEIWETTTDRQGTSHHVLLRRMGQSERRTLWEVLKKALTQVPSEISWSQTGHLAVQAPGYPTCRIRLLATTEATSTNSDWNQALKIVLP